MQRIGRYEVLGHLASGGMGQVYLARTTGLGGFERQVVVKTLDVSIHDEDGDSFVTMFLDEARLVGKLHHQYISPVYEVGCDEEGRYYIVMDYVHGETAELVWKQSKDQGRALSLPFALTVVSAVASALDYAHSLRAADGTPLDIVHRDVSLSNVMIGHDGAVKLIDFGIAKAANRATKTQVGTLKGKIGYLSPEQILRKQVDHRADIFALGIVLYELTTMTRAFRETSDLVTLERITGGQVTPPSDLVRDYPRGLEHIVMKALAVDPDLRFQDAGAMGREIEMLAATLGHPLGHAAVVQTMRAVFGEHEVASRRRFARSSTEVATDQLIAMPPADDPDKTPVAALEPAIATAGEMDADSVEIEEPAVEETTEPRALPDVIHDFPTAPLASFRASSPVLAPPGHVMVAPPRVEPPQVIVRINRTATGSDRGPALGRAPQPSPHSGTALVYRRAPDPWLRLWLVAATLFAVAAVVAAIVVLV